MEHLWIIIKYAFLGLVQGFTEPIPISSSGHLVIVEDLMGLKIDGLSFEVLMNTASLLAVLVIYRKDLVRIIENSLQYLFQRKQSGKGDFKFVIYLVIGTIPAGVVGVLFKDTIEEHLKGVAVVGAMLIVTGFALWVIRNLRGRKGDHSLSLTDAIIIGLAQAIALIPGISRSGSTIVAAMGLGLKQETALRFSFFLYIPVSVGGILLSISDLLEDPNKGQLFIPYIIGFIICFLASYYSLRWFMGIMAKGKLIYFSIYCVLLGAFILLFMR